MGYQEDWQWKDEKLEGLSWNEVCDGDLDNVFSLISLFSEDHYKL
jgi:hypothetical protein